MSKFEQELQRLQRIQQELTKSVTLTESRLKAFQSITKECIQYILTYEKKYCHRYVKIWFRSYLAMKDECMIAVNGEITRPYHVPLHQDFVHQRTEEKRYYNQKCVLSSCSIDGIDYEYRQLQTRFGSKSALNKIADKNDALGTRIDTIVRALEDSAVEMKTTINKIRGKMKFELKRHCSEFVEVSFENKLSDPLFPPVLTPTTSSPAVSSFTIQSEPLRKISQAIAFSTIVEPPPLSSENKPQSDGAPVTATENTGSSSPVQRKKKRKMLQLEDSEDDEEGKSTTKAKSAQSSLALALGGKETMNFGIDVSIDQIKRAYGVITDQDEPVSSATGLTSSVSDSIELEKRKKEEQQKEEEENRKYIETYKRQYISQRPDAIPSSLQTSSSFHQLKIKILNPYYHTPMSTTSAISTAPSSSSSSYSSFNDLHSITFTIDLYHIFDSSFSTLSSALYPSPNTTDAKEFVLPANRLFFALRRYLWYHYYDATHHYLPNSSTSGYIIHINQEKSLLERSLHQNNQLWFPRLIQLENVKYSKDDFISFSNPSQGGGKKLYPVLCENHELVVALMNHLHNWVNNPLENGSSSTDTSRKEVFRRIDWLWKMSAFLQHIVERLKSLPISSSTAVMDSFFNFDAMKHLPDEFSDIAQLDSWHSLFTGLTTSLNGSLPCTRSIRYQIGRSAMFWVMCQHFLSVNGLDAIFDPSSLLFLSSQAVSKVFTNACVVQELFLSFQHTLYLKCQSKDEKCSSLIRELEEKTLSGIQLHLKDLIERVGDQCYLKERDLGVCVIESPRVLFIELLRDRLNPLLLPLPWNQFLQVLLQRSRDLRILFLQDCLQIEWKLMNQDGVVGYSVNTLLQLILLLEGLISACSEKETPAQTAVQLTVVIPELCRFPTITEFYSYKCKDVGITLMAKLPSDDDNHVIVALPKELKQSSTLPVLADFCSIWNAL